MPHRKYWLTTVQMPLLTCASVPAKTRTIDRKSSEEKEVVRDQLKPEDRSSLIQFEKEKADRLATSARLLYDMAKIALGALLTCLTQMINAVVVAQRRGPAE